MGRHINIYGKTYQYLWEDKFRPKLYGIERIVCRYFPHAPKGITTPVELSSDPNCNAWSVMKLAASLGSEQLLIMSTISWSSITKLKPSVNRTKNASWPCWTWRITKFCMVNVLKSCTTDIHVCKQCRLSWDCSFLSWVSTVCYSTKLFVKQMYEKQYLRKDVWKSPKKLITLTITNN